MFHIWKLILIWHRRKKHILWLMICVVITILCMTLIQPLSLGEWEFVTNALQHQITEVIWILFLVYFGATSINQFNHTKITQLLRSKQKKPIAFISQLRAGTYSIYATYIISTYIATLLFNWTESNITEYINLLVSGSTILTITMILSLLINTYSAMIWSLIMYGISYSINFILFSTPITFQTNVSYQILTFLQYLFPRFDLIYSTTGQERIRATGWNIIYWITAYCIFVYMFLHQYKK
jgi:hypothetical protein